jgi:hypothetical protein
MSSAKNTCIPSFIFRIKLLFIINIIEIVRSNCKLATMLIYPHKDLVWCLYTDFLSSIISEDGYCGRSQWPRRLRRRSWPLGY